jgi:hypothetical protein
MSELQRVIPDSLVDDALHLQAELTATVHERAARRMATTALYETEVALRAELLDVLEALRKDQCAEFNSTINNKMEKK